jgi:intein-encoded DNA endonuclease-like protein
MTQLLSPERTNYLFYENGYYKIENEMLFQPPNSAEKRFTIYNSNLAVKTKKKGLTLTAGEPKDLENVPSTFMICYLNGFDEAKEKLGG